MGDVLRGMKAICDYYGIGRKRFEATLADGAPIVKDGREWITSVREMDEYYRRKCRREPERKEQ